MRAQSIEVVQTLLEQPETEYRVHFWERPTPDYAWNLDAWTLSDCQDVREVIAWTESNAQGRRHQIFAIAGNGQESILVPLMGEDPNSHPVPWGSPT